MVLVDQWDDLGQPRPASAKIIPPGGMILVDRWDDFGPTIPILPLFNSMKKNNVLFRGFSFFAS